MSKVRKNVSIDPQLAQIIDEREEFNLSGFVNKCLEQHFSASGATSPEKAVVQAQLEQLEEEIADISTDLERKRSRRAELEERLDDVGSGQPDLLNQAISKLDGTPRDPTNPAIQTWASKLGMSAEELVNNLPEQNNTL